MNRNAGAPPTLCSVDKIWDLKPHNALTDLIYYQNRWLLTFRESDQHVYGENGSIRIIASSDRKNWNSIACFTENHVDLRDPKLSVMPDGRLMLLLGGTVYKDDLYVTRQPLVAFSSNGTDWTSLEKILLPHEWLWRVTWHEGLAYGASYSFSDPTNLRAEWDIKLFVSKDGLDYDLVTVWDIDHYPSETTIRFLKDGTMVALVRRGGRVENQAWIGTSPPPYYQWKWKALKEHIGGPNFLILPDETMWAAGRFFQTSDYGTYEKTALARLDLTQVTPLLYLPSGGDSSYPGMVYHEGKLVISYYSSHEGNTSIYLSEIELPKG